MKSAFEFSKNKKLITCKEFDSAIKHLNNNYFPVSIKNYLTINSIGEVPKEAPSDIFSQSDDTNQIDFDDNLID